MFSGHKGDDMRIDNTRSIRAARVRAKKLAAGMVSRTVYLPLDTLESLGRAFPGPAGGIEWTRVATAALRPEPEVKRPKATGTPPKDPTAAERQRRCRERKRAGQPATDGGA